MQAMQQTLDKLLKDSKLKYKGKQWGHGNEFPVGGLPPPPYFPNSERKNYKNQLDLFLFCF